MKVAIHDPRHWVTRERYIYAFVFYEAEENWFYINDSVSPPRKFCYEHFHGRCALTRSTFQRYEALGTFPLLYRLDTVIGTKSDTFVRKLEWGRYLTEHGFKCGVEVLIPYIVTFQGSAYFDTISQLPLHAALSEEKAYYRRFIRKKR